MVLPKEDLSISDHCHSVAIKSQPVINCTPLTAREGNVTQDVWV